MLHAAHQRMLAAVPESSPPARHCKTAPKQATIEKLNDDARGIARHEGKVTFIEGALPGESVTFCTDKQHSRYDTAWTLSVDAPSPDRVSPVCAHFGICGGCSLQHLASTAQADAKETVLRDKFHQFGRLCPDTWLDPLTGPSWHYRRSARIGIRFVARRGSVMVGFRERASRLITPLKHCHILDRRIADLLPELHHLINAISCRRRVPQIEIACSNDVACMVFRHLVPFTEKDLALLRSFAQDYGIHVCTQAGDVETIQGLWPRDLPELSYDLDEFDLNMAYSPAHFVQTNTEINQAMVHQAIHLLAPQPDETVADLFCGLGNFTLPLARHAGQVIGVENHEGLLHSARHNAMINQIDNARFQCTDLYDKAAARRFWKKTDCQLLLLDPPRTGALEALKHLPKGQVRRILYVSCQPATLARDCDYLVNTLGYHLKSTGIMDMFPQTSHIESMALLEMPD